MNVFRTIWKYGHSYYVIYSFFTRQIVRIFLSIIVIIVMLLWSFSDDYYKRVDCNTFTLAAIVSVDTVKIDVDPYRNYEYTAKCVYKVSGKEYKAEFPGFEVSPPVGLEVPVYYNSGSPHEYTFYSEFRKIQINPYYYYVKQKEQEKKKTHSTIP